jgi:hypothetical protein
VIIAALYKGIPPKDVTIVTAPLLAVIGVINFPFRLITLRLLPMTVAHLGFPLQPGAAPQELDPAVDDLDPRTETLEEIASAPAGKSKPNKKPAAKKTANKYGVGRTDSVAE